MTDNTGSGSQAGQSSAGSQAGQQNSGQQSQQQQGDGTGSQAESGQQQAQPPFFAAYMQEGETVEQALARHAGATQTARKQAAGYRQRLGEGDGSGSQAGQGQQGQQQQGQGQQGQGQQSSGDDATTRRIAALETELRQTKAATRQTNIERQLRTALENEGAVNPTLTLKMIDLETLDIGDDGVVTDPLGPVRQLKATMPQVFQDRTGGGDGGPGNTGGGDPNDFNSMIRARARR